MSIFDNYSEIGKSNIKSTRSEFISSIGIDGTKSAIENVLLGGNVRDITEFIVQKRLANSYASLLDLFACPDLLVFSNPTDYANAILAERDRARDDREKILCLWLLGLTKKGLDNIVRGSNNLSDYVNAFSSSTIASLNSLEEDFGELSGTLKLGEKEFNVTWETLLPLLMAVGSQTLTIRGSAKSMNGKMFEKLVLGSLLSILGFRFYDQPPRSVDTNEKAFWLSNMDVNERETDATIVYHRKAISIDIGFIGKGNPEITLDKVSRFGRYKDIGGIRHDMATIIIVDTVADNSDLINKAHRVNGHVIQMRHADWVAQFANLLKTIYQINYDFVDYERPQYIEFLHSRLSAINITQFL